MLVFMLCDWRQAVQWRARDHSLPELGVLWQHLAPCFVVINQSLLPRKHSVDASGHSTKQVRVKVLTDEQRKAIQSLTSPDQIPLEERRRQYMAIGRVMKSGKDLPAGLIEKWNGTGKDSKKKPLGLCLVLELASKVRVP